VIVCEQSGVRKIVSLKKTDKLAYDVKRERYVDELLEYLWGGSSPVAISNWVKTFEL
jgi:hypothetical protein